MTNVNRCEEMRKNEKTKRRNEKGKKCKMGKMRSEKK